MTLETRTDHRPSPEGLPARLGLGVELLGPFEGSGATEPSYLIRLGQGQVVAVSGLLFQLAGELDGQRGPLALAGRLREATGRPVSAGNVAHLLEHKLAPLGILHRPGLPPGGDGAVAAGRGSHLGVRRAVFPPRPVHWLAQVLGPFFRPPVVVAVLAGFAVMDCWLFAQPGRITSMSSVLTRPGIVLAIGILTLAASVWHELGHATASQYGGAKPGPIGVGLYLIWPVMFTDLTDSYRLSRAGRLRADLGGVYFNAIFMLALAGIYGLTGTSWLLVVIVLQHLVVAQQFLPFLRLDGYYLVSDLIGVPDLFDRLKAQMLTLVGRTGSRSCPSRSPELKAYAQRVVAAWVAGTVALGLAGLGALAVRLPGSALAAGRFAHRQSLTIAGVRGMASLPAALLAGVRLAVVVIPLAAFGLALARRVRTRGERPRPSHGRHRAHLQGVRPHGRA